jgi:hypothetical protein
MCPVRTEPPNRMMQNLVFEVLDAQESYVYQALSALLKSRGIQYGHWGDTKGTPKKTGANCLDENMIEPEGPVSARRGLELVWILARCAQGRSRLVEIRSSILLTRELVEEVLRNETSNEKKMKENIEKEDECKGPGGPASVNSSVPSDFEVKAVFTHVFHEVYVYATMKNSQRPFKAWSRVLEPMSRDMTKMNTWLQNTRERFRPKFEFFEQDEHLKVHFLFILCSWELTWRFAPGGALCASVRKQLECIEK